MDSHLLILSPAVQIYENGIFYFNPFISISVIQIGKMTSFQFSLIAQSVVHCTGGGFLPCYKWVFFHLIRCLQSERAWHE